MSGTVWLTTASITLESSGFGAIVQKRYRQPGLDVSFAEHVSVGDQATARHGRNQGLMWSGVKIRFRGRPLRGYIEAGKKLGIRLRSPI